MKDDSAREKAIDRLLARRLGARLQDDGRDCPDAEVLAAYVERTLSEGERRTCETHLADCPFCQEQVAQLVRLNEGDEIEEAARPIRAKPRTAWFRWALAAPALVALVVAGLWQTGELQQFLKQGEPATVESPEAPAPSPATQPHRNATAAKAPAGGELNETARLKPETPKEAEAPAAAPRISVYGSPGSSVEVKPAEGAGPGYGAGVGSSLAASGRSDERQTLAQAGLPSNAPSAAPSAATEAKAESGLGLQDKDQTRRADQLGMAAKKAAPVQVQSEAVTLEKGQDSGVEFHGFIQNRRTWRVGRQGLIQKAAADGSWETRPSGVKSDLFGISFANSKVGWAVGQGGTVLRTTDGGDTWTRMPSPSTEDLVRVGAISETKVNVITRSGQTLQSADGGNTWKLLG